MKTPPTPRPPQLDTPVFAPVQKQAALELLDGPEAPIRSARFTPGEKDGRVVRSRVMQSFQF